MAIKRKKKIVYQYVGVKLEDFTGSIEIARFDQVAGSDMEKLQTGQGSYEVLEKYLKDKAEIEDVRELTVAELQEFSAAWQATSEADAGKSGPR